MSKPHVLLDPANFWLWLVPAILIAIAGGLGTELVKEPHSGYLWLCLFTVIAVIVLLGFLLSEKVRRMLARNRTITLGIHGAPPRAKALIVFVSMGHGITSARDAALYHADAGVLQDLWMITSKAVSANAEKLGAELKTRFPALTIHNPICVDDIYSIPEAKAQVEAIRKTCLRKFKSEADVICDFTGFTKSMSAGMILACAPKDARLQYMHPRGVLPTGQADIAAGSDPVEVEIGYQLEDDS